MQQNIMPQHMLAFLFGYYPILLEVIADLLASTEIRPYGRFVE